MSIFSTIGKVGKEIGSILSAGYTNPSKSGGKTSALASMYDKYKADLSKAKSYAGGLFGSKAQASGGSGGGGGNSTNSNTSSFKGALGNALGSSSKSSSSSKGVGGGGGSASKAAGSASAANKAQQAADKAQQEAEDRIRKSINQGYDDASTGFDAATSALGNSDEYINSLGRTRDEYLASLEGYKGKMNEAVEGNKRLIEQNQKRDLEGLAKDTRKSMDNTNIMLGIKGASGGSASKGAARAIAGSAGKERAGILTGYGDEFSKQNQQMRNAVEEYNTKRAQAYKWEETAHNQALDDYNADFADLDLMKKKKSGWRDEDIKALSDRNLQTLKGRLTDIQTRARNFRDKLAAKMTEQGSLTDALNVAAVNVDAPAELDTPKFDEDIDMTDPNNAEDWFDPSNINKQRVIKGYDALGNPIYDDEVLTDIPVA